MKVIIVIVSYNSAEDLPECLTSVKNLLTTNYSLLTIVVDNSSDDNSVDVAKKFDVEVIENSENLGFSGGANVGIKATQKFGANFILLLNPDTTVHPSLIYEFLKIAKKNEKIGILSPKIYFYPGFEFHKSRYKKEELGKVIWYAGGVIDWDNVLASHKGVDEVDSGLYNKITETDFATGATMMIKVEVFKKIGNFDEKFFLYLEDLDFSLRAKKAGFSILYVPKAIAWHKWARATGGGSALQDYYFTRNRLLFGLKYTSFRAKFALIRESFKFLMKNGVKRQAVLDFYLGRFGKGSFKA